jgi:single-stranded-DNA-specific exonuclease
VVGISAARLADRFGVPAAVVGIQNGSGRGSVRSAAAVDVRAALDATADLLVKYGGHREAAGFTIEPRHLPEFAARFEAAVRAQGPPPTPPGLDLDAELEVHEVVPELGVALETLEPYGTGHPEPLFLLRDLRVGSRTRRVGDAHLKLELEAGGRRLEAIAFGWAERVTPASAVGQQLDLVVYVRRQDPRWGGGPQLVVADLGTHGVELAPARTRDRSAS